MASSNRVRVALVREVTLGTTPGTPRMRTERITGESLKYTPKFVASNELRSDRMNADPVKVNETTDGGINFEFSYPEDATALSERLASVMFNDWVNTPSRDNDGTADSVITDVAATGGVFTVTAGGGDPFVAGHLIKATGFTNSGNNSVFKITTGSDTVPAVGNSLLTDESAPPAAAKIKVVGFQGSANQHVLTAVVNAGGSGGTPGAVTITGTTGTGTKFQATGTIESGGALAGALVVTVKGDYSVNPDDISAEPITGGSLSGCTVTLTMGGDLSVTSSGLASELLDFTTLGLTAGQWIKVGGTATIDKFATAADNDFVRVTAIAAHALTCDNLPSGWTADVGAGKTIKVWFGDHIKNGTTTISHSTERAFLDQTVPTYILHKGLVANTLQLTIASEKEITGSFGFMGMSSVESTSVYGTSYDAATTSAVMAGSVNVGRIAESGSTITSPNWAQSLTININNNLRMLTAVDSIGAVNLQPGDCNVTGQMPTYFGSDSLYAKLIAGTVGAINSRVAKNSQAVIFQIPRVTFTDGSPNAAQKNTDVTLPLSYEASYDSTTAAHIWIDRLPYYE